MFEFVTMPLTHFWDLEDQDPKELEEALGGLQKALSDELGREVSWKEPLGGDEDADYEADVLDPYCVYALRALAAHLERHDDIKGFDPGVAPWDHEAFAALDEDVPRKFPQLLHSDADVMVFAPTELPDVYYLDAGTPEDEEAEEFAVGSLPSLVGELEVLNKSLGLAGNIDELPGDVVFDPDEDPLAAAKYAWAVAHAAVLRSVEAKLPLIVFFDPDLADEIAEEAEAEAEED